MEATHVRATRGLSRPAGRPASATHTHIFRRHRTGPFSSLVPFSLSSPGASPLFLRPLSARGRGRPAGETRRPGPGPAVPCGGVCLTRDERCGTSAKKARFKRGGSAFREVLLPGLSRNARRPRTDEPVLTGEPDLRACSDGHSIGKSAVNTADRFRTANPLYQCARVDQGPPGPPRPPPHRGRSPTGNHRPRPPPPHTHPVPD